LPPTPQITVFSKGSQNVVRPLYQHRSQIPVALLSYVHPRLALAGVPAPGRDSDAYPLQFPLQ
jgi:hypothetical protein